MDIFDQKGIRPMLIADMQEPFDSPDYLYELKLDGERCVAYLDGESTVLQNKRGIFLNPRYPELCQIHRLATEKCVLDGELAVLVDGKPKFSEIQRRSLLTNKFRIDMEAKRNPACFTAFDVLYYRDHPVMDISLVQRKQLLEESVGEDGRLAISRWIQGAGVALYTLAAEQDLEGVVAKKTDSLYFPGKRTKDWIKFKNLKDDDYIVCGYIKKGGGVISLVLGQYNPTGDIVDKGHVTLGVSQDAFRSISHTAAGQPLFPQKPEYDVMWLQPQLVCTVKFMEKTTTGGLRQPIFKGLRPDKLPEECVDGPAE